MTEEDKKVLSHDFIGFRFSKKYDRKTDSILCEIWQDIGDNKDKPGNNWKLISSQWQNEKKWNPPSDHQESFGECNISQALEAFDNRLDNDRKYALENNIMCEHPGCKWGADHRCSECLAKGIDRWFCRPFRYVERYYGPYQFHFEKGTPHIVYVNDHIDAHSEIEHPTKSMWKWIDLGEGFRKEDNKDE